MQTNLAGISIRNSLPLKLVPSYIVKINFIHSFFQLGEVNNLIAAHQLLHLNQNMSGFN